MHMVVLYHWPPTVCNKGIYQSSTREDCYFETLTTSNVGYRKCGKNEKKND